MCCCCDNKAGRLLIRYFVRISRNKFGMGSALICVFALLVTLTVLTIQQIFPVNDAYDVQLLGGFFSAWNTNVCRNLLVQFLSPFLFNFKVHAFDQELGLLGCPWRERNSILRLSFLTLVLISTVWMLVVLITRNGQQHWKMLSWCFFVWAFLMSVIFVLDADGIYSGYEACINNFDVGGFGPIVLTLVGASFTTTLPPYFYSNPFFIPYQNEDSDTLIIEDFAITDGCYLTPFVYTLLVDAGLTLFCYLVYRMSKIYDFERTPANAPVGYRAGAEEEEEEGLCPCLNKREKRRHKSSLAERDGNRDGHRSSAHPHQVTTPVFPNVYETEIHGSSANPNPTLDAVLEPEHWNPRKATYEQNFS